MTKWNWILPAICCAFPLNASQIFHMSLDEVVGMAETVFLASVEGVGRTPSEWVVQVDFELRVIEVLLGPDSLAGTTLDAFYTMDLPRAFVDCDGTEVWESPIVFGSGIEMTAGVGDTVLALAWLPDADSSVNLARLEHADSLESVRNRLGPGSGQWPRRVHTLPMNLRRPSSIVRGCGGQPGM